MAEEKTTLTNAIEFSEGREQYDANIKELLANKEVLSRIMQGTITEFKEYPIDVIMDCIEGKPEISTIPVHQVEKITGMPTEDKVPGEGKVTYDVRFYALTPDGAQIKLIIDVEAQKKYNPGYDLVTRGVYYCSRMISAQKTREFERSDYDRIKKVYSIWICMGVPKNVENTITEYHIIPHDIIGEYQGDARYDLLSVIMIRLGQDAEKKYKGTLLGFLGTLLLIKDTKDKLNDLENIYGLQPTKKIIKEVDDMCNLSDLVWEDGTKAAAKKTVLVCIKKGYSIDETCEFVPDLTREEVEEIYNEEIC